MYIHLNLLNVILANCMIACCSALVKSHNGLHSSGIDKVSQVLKPFQGTGRPSCKTEYLLRVVLSLGKLRLI